MQRPNSYPRLHTTEDWTVSQEKDESNRETGTIDMMQAFPKRCYNDANLNEKVSNYLYIVVGSLTRTWRERYRMFMSGRSD